MEQDPRPSGAVPMVYICGDCCKENELKQKDTLVCHECGFRVMYKKRTKRMIQFDAR
eukprot:m.215192 g.215192  ORF g.215192 m.215192 type:complete len:57 (+) comp22200_c0_seq5:78-248(+)